MKVKYINGKWVVTTSYTQQIIFCHKSKSECYEFIFKTVNYA